MDDPGLVADDELLLVGVQTHAVDGLVGLEKEMSDLLSNITDIRKEGREDIDTKKV